MKMSAKILAISILVLLHSCSMIRVIPEGQSMLVSNEIDFNSKKPDELADIDNYIKQTPKRGIFGFQPSVALYNTGNLTGKGWDKIAEKMGTPPLIFDANLVKSSVDNMLNHMKYKGFYDSKITYEISTDNKKTKVKYIITPGKRYIIDTVTYSIPDVNMYDIMTTRSKSAQLNNLFFLRKYYQYYPWFGLYNFYKFFFRC